MLYAMCLDAQFPIARCFSFYNKAGAEIACSINAAPNRNIPDLTLNLLNLAVDLVDRFCSKKEIMNEFKADIDIIRLSNNHISGIKGISSTLFVETLMKHEMNFNRYFIQGDYILPLQKGRENGMVSETPKKEEMLVYNEYLTAMKKLSFIQRFFAAKNKETGDYVHELIRDMKSQKETALYQVAIYCHNIYSIDKLEEYIADCEMEV